MKNNNNQNINIECPYCNEVLGSLKLNKVGTHLIDTDIDTTSIDSHGVTWSLRNLLYRNWTFEQLWNTCNKCNGESFIPTFIKPKTSVCAYLYNLLDYDPGDKTSCEQRNLKDTGYSATILDCKNGLMSADSDEGLLHNVGGLKIILFNPFPDGALFLEEKVINEAVHLMLKEEDFKESKFSLMGSFQSVFELFLDRVARKLQSKVRVLKWRFKTFLTKLNTSNPCESFDDEAPF